MARRYNNLTQNFYKRQENDQIRRTFERKFHVDDSLIARLGLWAELEGHAGCVNCLAWNEKGTMLASGSDDFTVRLWDPFGAKKSLSSIETGHVNNIFSVLFAPETGDRILVTGAGDCKVRVHDVENARRANASSGGDSTIQVYGCHFARVKRVAAHRQEPHVILSAGEDGLVMQYDLRESANCRSYCSHSLINLNAHLGPDCEIKCLALNPQRPEMMAIGANDHFVRVYDRRMIASKPVKLSYDGSRRVQWDRSAILSLNMENVDYNFPPDSVQYFIAGHLAVKCADRRNRFRRLTTTYLTFDPSGKSLLVNLGGEQIYLFDLYDEKKTSLLEDFRRFFDDRKSQETKTLNGFQKLYNKNGLSRFVELLNQAPKSPKNAPNLPFGVQLLKLKANSEFDRENFDSALASYSRAIEKSPKTAILYSNRAAAYLRRDWDGDTYAALRDCYTTLHSDPENFKALFRLCKCLHQLNQYRSAQCCLEIFMQKYPEQARSHSCTKLWNEISSSIENHQDSDSPTNKRQKTLENDAALHHQQENDDFSIDSLNEEVYTNSTTPPTINNFLSDQEISLQSRAYDYCKRYCGHCNTTTDIKEANFFGCNSEYVMGGSDDGKFFIWDSRTCEIVKAMVGDDKIVNCLQPHPSQCLLATSGIEHTVKLWSPLPENGAVDARNVSDKSSADAARANQRRMNADPLEMMLLNMGYRLSGLMDNQQQPSTVTATSDQDDDESAAPALQCYPS